MHETISSDTGPFAVVPEWVLDLEISDRALRLYTILSRYADQEGKAFPSRRTLATRLRCSVDSVDRAMKELDAEHLVMAVHRYEDDGTGTLRRQTSNEYAVVRHPGRTGAAGEGRVGAAPGTRATTERESSSTANAVDSLARVRERTAGEQVWKVDRKPVAWEHARLAQDVLAAWNELTQQDLRARTWLAKIVMRIREYPEATLDDHRYLIERNLAHPWWKGAPTPSVIYGSDAQFERSVMTARHEEGDHDRIERIVNAVMERGAA